MVSIITAQNGDWNTASTWTGGVVPTSADVVTIDHAVTVGSNFTAKEIMIRDGSLSVADSWAQLSSITATVNDIVMARKINDDRKVNLDGVILSGIKPSISSADLTNDGWPKTNYIIDNGSNIIIDDPGFISSSSQMQDIKPEGVAHAYARKISNMVRYITITVKIRNDSLQYLNALYRMQQGPFQVLTSTKSCVIKGHIETVAPDTSSVGKEYVSVRVTIAEGRGA